MTNKNYTETFSYSGAPMRVYATSDEAWEAYETLKHGGWAVCSAGNYENALVKLG